MKRSISLAAVLAAGVVLLLGAAGSAADAESQKWALLIGVDRYEHDRLRDLRYCGADAVALRNLLVRRAGFPKEQVIVLHDGAQREALRPSRASIRDVLADFLARPEPGDLVVVGFSGHGTHIDATSYLCPRDADPSRPGETMLPVPGLYKLFDDRCRARRKVVLIDACRNASNAGRGVAVEPLEPMPRELARSIASVPKGLRVFSSASAGEASYEDGKLKAGVFMHYLLEGLSGRADQRSRGAFGNGNRRIEDTELFQYASEKTRQHVQTHFSADQTPEWHCLTSEFIELAELPAPQARVTNSIGVQFVLVPRGSFLMGSPDDEGHANERPQHRVWITEDFYVGVTEVTQAQYEKVMGRNPSYFSADGPGSRRVAGRDTARHPVERVNYDDACRFCRKLAAMEGLPEGTYRLPTEAEWEYAARAGTTAEYGPAGSPLGLPSCAWFDGNASQRTHEVGSLAANPFGLYDVQGNVAEWCADWYDPEYYGKSPQEDPAGPTEAAKNDWKVARGGAWCFSSKFCRAADRYAVPAGRREILVGFRVIRAIDPPVD